MRQPLPPTRLSRTTLLACAGFLAATPAVAEEPLVPYLVKDINPGLGDSTDGLTAFSTSLNGEVYFRATDGTTSGWEVWKTDGTTAGTQLLSDVNPGAGGSFPENVTVAGGAVYFFGSTGTPTGSKVFRSDGTAAGTQLLVDTWPETNIGFFGPPAPGNFTTYGDDVIFRANTADHGQELWITDGTTGGTSMIKDVHPGVAGSVPVGLTEFNGKIYYAADDLFTDTGGGVGYFDRELFVTDGTADGTFRVKDINPGTQPSVPFGFETLNGQLIFRANDGTNGTELWTSDGTSGGTQMLVDIHPTASSNTQDHTVVGSRMFFSADDGAVGAELWLTDGTAGGTQLVKDINPADGSLPGSLTPVGDRIFFSADDGTHGTELWVSDGTDAGTHLVKDINPGEMRSSPMELVTDGEHLFFTAILPDDENFTVQTQLWMTDGTEGGTEMLYQEPGDSFGYAIDNLTLLGDKLLFFAPADVDADGYSVNRELFAITIPEPGTMGLAGIACLALLRRRRGA